jgi:hypothetical protein
MAQRKIKFDVVERPNGYAKGRKEFAFIAKLDGNPSWTLTTWNKRPTTEVIKQAEELVLRAFLFYHEHTETPPFDIEQIAGYLKSS